MPPSLEAGSCLIEEQLADGRGNKRNLLDALANSHLGSHVTQDDESNSVRVMPLFAPGS